MMRRPWNIAMAAMLCFGIAITARAEADRYDAANSSSRSTTTTGTVQELGPFSYYNFLSSDGTMVSGTSQKLGPFTYYTLRGSDGTITTGNSQELGPFTYYNLHSTGTDAGQFTSTTTTGSSQELGPFTYYNFRTSGTEAGRYETTTTTGTSQELGPFTYFNLHSSDGSSTSGSIQTIGTTDYWTLGQIEPVEVDSNPFSSIFDED